MMVGTGNLPLATTKQFRSAAKLVLGNRIPVRGRSYTDKSRSFNGTYYVGIRVTNADDKDITNIEFILWCLGVTAKTRAGSYDLGGFKTLRGTCVKAVKNQ